MIDHTSGNDIEKILLNLVEEVSSIRAGKTFTPTDYTNPATQAIHKLITQARIDTAGRIFEAYDRLNDAAFVNFYDTYIKEVQNEQ